jgi:hypothetical protein
MGWSLSLLEHCAGFMSLIEAFSVNSETYGEICSLSGGALYDIDEPILP